MGKILPKGAGRNNALVSASLPVIRVTGLRSVCWLFVSQGEGFAFQQKQGSPAGQPGLSESKGVARSSWDFVRMGGRRISADACRAAASAGRGVRGVRERPPADDPQKDVPQKSPLHTQGH